MAGTSIYQDGGGEMIADINVTPLVDVVLVLLVIFMVTAPMMAARGILVKTPETVSGQEVSGALNVTIKAAAAPAAGQTPHFDLYVNGHRQADDAAARAELERLRRGNAEIKAVISAASDVPHGEVMRAIDQVEQAGIHKFALASQRPKDRAGKSD